MGFSSGYGPGGPRTGRGQDKISNAIRIWDGSNTIVSYEWIIVLSVFLEKLVFPGMVGIMGGIGLWIYLVRTGRVGWRWDKGTDVNERWI